MRRKLLACATCVPIILTLAACSGSAPKNPSHKESHQDKPTTSSPAKVNPEDVFDPSGYDLDPRYADGAYGVWYAKFPDASSDLRRVDAGRDVTSKQFQGWVAPDGQSVIVALNSKTYPSMIASFDLFDGKLKWKTNLSEHRQETESQSHPEPGFSHNPQCLPMLAGSFIACNNVGLINVEDGKVRPTDKPVDFMGISGEGDDTLFLGNTYPETREQTASAGAWNATGKAEWILENHLFTYSGIGEDYGIVAATTSSNQQIEGYEIIDLSDGKTRHVLVDDPQEARSLERASATIDGVMTFTNRGQDPRSITYSVALIDPATGEKKIVEEQRKLEQATTPIGLWQPKISHPLFSAEHMLNALHISSIFQEGRLIAPVTSGGGPASTFYSPDTFDMTEALHTDIYGVTVDDSTVLLGNNNEIVAITPSGDPLWSLTSTPALNGQHGYFRAGGYMMAAISLPDEQFGLYFIAPGTPKWKPSKNDKTAPDGSPLPAWKIQDSHELSPFPISPVSSGRMEQAGSSATSPEGGMPSVSPATPPSSSLPQVQVEAIPQANIPIIGLQEFANDLANGRFDKIREYCWTIAPSTMEREYFAPESRKVILEAVSRPGNKLDGGGEWVTNGGKVVASEDELSSPYSCPFFYPGGQEDPLTKDDVDLLMRRAIGVAQNKPIRKGDNGHYQLLCNGSLDTSFVEKLERIRTGNMTVHRVRSNGIHSVYAADSQGEQVLISRNVLTGGSCIQH